MYTGETDAFDPNDSHFLGKDVEIIKQRDRAGRKAGKSIVNKVSSVERGGSEVDGVVPIIELKNKNGLSYTVWEDDKLIVN